MPLRFAWAAVAFIFCCIVAAPHAAVAQAGAAELLVRVERLENQLRQVTGQLEQLQYRNQQLEATLKRLQDDYEFRLQEQSNRGGPRLPARPSVAQPVQPPGPPVGRRSDAFDPNETPNAPGAPRVLGTLPGNTATPPPRGEGPVVSTEEPPQRGVGAPLDLTNPAPPAAPPPRAPGASGPYAVATAPPSSAREIIELGTGYVQRKEYALAEETFREFLKKYPSDRLAGEAQFWFGESLFLRQNYQDAANAFVLMSKKYENSAKAPDALLRLGQSLAALNEKELACVAFGDIGRKYPRASTSIKQAVEREQRRVRC
jgi:tol-pal system protein YbgF